MAKKARVYDGTAWQELASAQTDLTAYSTTAQTTAGFRNDIINGDFRINQRAFTSTTTTATYGLDRWYLETNTGTSTYSTQSFTPGNAISGYEPINFARIVTSGQSATGSFSLLTQQIEDVRNLAGQTATVSFWAKAASGTPKVAVTLDQLFGSGGSPSSTVNNLFGTVTLSTSWTRYTLTATVASISGKTIGTTANTSALRLRLWVSGGSDLNPSAQSIGTQNNTFDFWGVQVEAGSVATPFEQRPIGTELDLCQRYYQILTFDSNAYLGMYASGPSFWGHPVSFVTKMRTSPVASYSYIGANQYWAVIGTAAYSGNSTTGMSFSSSDSSVRMIQLRQAGGSTPTVGNIYAFEASFSILLSAEL